MKQRELIEQIEAYLNNELTPELRTAWEQRLAEDASLRREQELQRQMHHDFDAGRLNLRANLRAIMEEEPPSENAGKRWWWIGLLGFVLIAGFVVWQWQPFARVTQETAPVETPVKTPDQKPLTPPLEKPDSLNIARPMAMSDPARFVPNPGMEAFVASGLRSGPQIQVKMSFPENGMRFMPYNKGVVKLRFTGLATWQEDQKPTGFVLTFFDNRNANKPLLELPVPVQDASAGNLKIDMLRRLEFVPGLYYFTLEESGEGEVLYAGKFFVGK